MTFSTVGHALTTTPSIPRAKLSPYSRRATESTLVERCNHPKSQHHEVSRLPISLLAPAFLLNCVQESHCDLYKPLTKEERRKRNKFIDLRVERGQVEGFGEGRKMQDVP